MCMTFPRYAQESGAPGARLISQHHTCCCAFFQCIAFRDQIAFTVIWIESATLSDVMAADNVCSWRDSLGTPRRAEHLGHD